MSNNDAKVLSTLIAATKANLISLSKGFGAKEKWMFLLSTTRVTSLVVTPKSASDVILETIAFTPIFPPLKSAEAPKSIERAALPTGPAGLGETTIVLVL